MANHCINRNTKEFQVLIKEVGGNPVSLGADIAIWQELNDEDRFPTKDEIKSIRSDENIKSSSKTPKEVITEKVYERQYTFFKRMVNKLEKQLEKVTKNTDQYTILESELLEQKKKLENATKDANKEVYIQMANEYLDEVETFLNTLSEGESEYSEFKIHDYFELLNSFPSKDFPELKARPDDLLKRFAPIVFKHNISKINKYNTSGVIITEEMIDAQNKDVSWRDMSFGSLSDMNNYIASTIGSVIKEAQNKASTANKKIEAKIQHEVDLLSEYAKSNVTTLEQVYEIFIQETKSGTIQLANKYTKEGELNPNFEKIMNTPELNRFYRFYQSTLKTFEALLPYKVGKFYMINKEKDSLSSTLNKLSGIENYELNSFVSNKDLIADMVPDMYRTHISSDKKSRNLGEGLLQFASYAENHNELSKALPSARLLQFQLTHKIASQGEVNERP